MTRDEFILKIADNYSAYEYPSDNLHDAQIRAALFTDEEIAQHGEELLHEVHMDILQELLREHFKP